jgi:biotin carboxyl carrier protein
VLGEPLFYGVAGQAVPPELEASVDQYVDQSHTRALVVLPLTDPEHNGEARTLAVGAVVLESFAAGPGEMADRATLATLGRQARLALARAVRYERIPAVRVWERLGRWCSASRLIRAALWLLPLAAVVAALVFVPSDFRVTCRGQLKPQNERRIFASRDGRIEQLHARHGETVAAGQLLATIRSSELDFERTRLLGEIQTTTEQLDAIRTSRLGANPVTAEQRDEYARQTAEEERLKKHVASLQEQKQILDGERDALQVRSPIAGQVLTWELAEALQQRPVKRGQQLMTVADTGGPWVLEVEVPDQDAGYVLDACRQLGPDLPVAFILATEPGRTYAGRLERVAQICEPDDRQQLSVAAVVAVEAAAIPQRRAGAGVVARIACGRRPLGYVWLHDLIQAVRAWLFV